MSGVRTCPQCGAEYDSGQRFCPTDGTTLRLQNETGDLIGTVVADRYHVLSKLGEGGMGQVYLAEHVKMGRKSALKVMNPAMVKNADAISRFNREASNASRINHPNVADVYDFGETADGVIYLAMELVEGPSLTKLVEEEGALPPRRAAGIIRQAAEALAVAHSMGIVHRDLKPDNIMLARNHDGSDWVKVVDFGIAKAADNEAQKVTKTGHVVGTPEYMSPEQLAGDQLDGRSDIYALGLVAFNLLTGKLPFPGATVQESMLMRLTEPPRRLSQMRPDIAWTPAVQSVLDKALARAVAARYQSASEFGRDFVLAVEAMLSPDVASPLSRTTEAIALPELESSSTAALAPTRVSDASGSANAESRGRTSRVIAGVGAAVLVAALAGSALVFSRRDVSAGREGVTRAGDAASQKGAAANTLSVDASLDSVEGLRYLEKNSASDARRAIAALDTLQQAPMTNAQRVRATILRAEARATLGENGSACQLMRDIDAAAATTNYGRRVRQFLRSGACS